MVPGRATCACRVLDDEGLPERLRELLAIEPGDGIGRPARRKRHDDRNLPGRIILRVGERTGGEKRGRSRNGLQNNIHSLAPSLVGGHRSCRASLAEASARDMPEGDFSDIRHLQRA
jgi:hypothetical protein